MARGHSERRSCQLVGIPRSVVRYEPRSDRNETLRARLKEVARPNTGYRQAWMQLRPEFAPLNAKRVHRLWKQEGLTGLIHLPFIEFMILRHGALTPVALKDVEGIGRMQQGRLRYLHKLLTSGLEPGRGRSVGAG